MNSDVDEFAWRTIRRLYKELEDPFVMMPMQSAASSLGDVLNELESAFSERTYGVTRKFWDVPAELLHEEKGFLIGNAFVLGQVAIEQSVAIFIRLRGYCSNMDTLPKQNIVIREYESEKAHSGLSEITVIDSVANYFKHQHEWPQQWDEASAGKFQCRTIHNAKAIGMSPSNSTTDNMEIALKDIGLYGDYGDLRSIADKVQSWRERLAKRLIDHPEIACGLGLHERGAS